ncbi:MAG: condensation domain-containing protein, partial [Acidobacteriota bacterium]
MRAALPRRPNGKVDYRSLPDPARPDGPAAGGTAPRGEVEEAIARAWTEVLGVESVRRSHHFFELGGDSILGIQVVSRLRQAGLAAAPKDIAALPVLADLAGALGRRSAEADSAAAPAAAAGPHVGALPLTPIQRWFFDRDLPEPQHWNLPALYELDPTLDLDALAPALESALGALLDRHDALRARFEPAADGGRRQIIEAPGAVRWPLEVTTVGGDGETRDVFARVHAGLDLARAPLAAAALVDVEDDPTAGHPVRRRLLLGVHHLVVDAVSWRILDGDLERALGAALAGDPVELPPTGHALGDLVEALERRRPDPAPWIAEAGAEAHAPDLPVGFAAAGEDATEADVEVHRQRVDGTADLRAPGDASLHDVLVTALALTLAPWLGRPTIRLDLEHHGRGGELDLSRTVGWLTAAYPVTLRLGELDPDAGRAFDAVEKTLASVDDPHDYGVLRYVQRRPELAHAPAPPVLFNFLGRAAARDLEPRRLLALADGAFDGARAARNPRAHALEINAALDVDGLTLDWIYPRGSAETVAALADHFGRHLHRVVDALRRRRVDPADFPGAEDAYRLSSLQEAMLIHRLEDVDADSGTLLVEATLDGPLDRARFEGAWRAAVDRHPSLRTALRWRGLEHPVQIVAPAEDVTLEIDVEDWRDDPGAQLERARGELRSAGLDLTRAPVMAWRLGRTGERRHVLLWACHHLLLDGWSSALVLREVLDRHDGLGPGPEPPPPKRWIDWSRRREPESFWRDARMEPRRVLRAAPLAAPASAGVPEMRGARTRTAAGELNAWIRRHGVTLGSVAAACWGLALHEATGSEQTSFGLTASGRGGELDGVESMVGMFTSVLPMTYRVDPQASPPKLARAVHTRQAAMQALPPRPLARLFELGGVRLLRPPFDTLLTVANFPTSPPGAGGVDDR